ncbi:MAG: hypothetical protein JXO22_00640 [Phycisphaerae bacterium]|nr:hypothetical protein [Phycisphaerae bacterium]
MRTHRMLVGGVMLILFGATAALAAFPIYPLIVEGDAVPGVGNMTSTATVAVNNLGQWYLEADTDNANADIDYVLLSGYQLNPFALAYQEGQPLASPPGASLDTFDAININDSGNSGWNFFLDGTSGTNDDSGIYFNADLVIQEGSLSTAPSMPNTPYIGFFDAKINNANQIIMTASCDIPGVGTTVDRALVRIDNPAGAFTETIIAKEADEIVPGRFITDLGTDPHETAFNSFGDTLYAVDVDGDSASNALIMFNNTKIAQEGDPSPIAGRVYSTLTSTKLDLNDVGDYVFTGSMDGDTASNALIVKNGAKFMQEGDTLASIGGVYTFTSFGSGPLWIDNGGNVVWYGDWNDPDTNIDTGLFWNDQLIVQEGVTTVNVGGTDYIVDTIRGISEGYYLSPNGEWLIFRAELVGGIDGAFMIQIPEPASLLLLALVALLRRR